MVDLKRERRFLFIAYLALTLFGILMIYESSCVQAFENKADAAYFLKRQLLFLFTGVFFFSLALLVDLENLRRYSKEFLLFTLLCLVLVVFIGKSAGGAKRWLQLGPFGFQPSEMLKISFLLY